jgi:bacterioferritin-associated ferredoxin
VAMQCGRCEGCARDVVAQCHATRPVAALRQETAESASGACAV